MASRWRAIPQDSMDSLGTTPSACYYVDLLLHFYLGLRHLHTFTCRHYRSCLERAHDHLPETVDDLPFTYDPSILIYVLAAHCLHKSSSSRLAPLHFILIAVFGNLFCAAALELHYATIYMRSGHRLCDTIRAMYSCAILQVELTT